jgi:hypothetical protein
VPVEYDVSVSIIDVGAKVAAVLSESLQRLIRPGIETSDGFACLTIDNCLLVEIHVPSETCGDSCHVDVTANLMNATDTATKTATTDAAPTSFYVDAHRFSRILEDLLERLGIAAEYNMIVLNLTSPVDAGARYGYRVGFRCVGSLVLTTFSHILSCSESEMISIRAESARLLNLTSDFNVKEVCDLVCCRTLWADCCCRFRTTSSPTATDSVRSCRWSMTATSGPSSLPHECFRRTHRAATRAQRVKH